MKCILMNKNTEVLLAEYDSGFSVFSKVYAIYNLNYASYILKCFDNDTSFRTNLSKWFQGRGIPSWRDKLDLLLHRLNIITSSELLDKAFGLSLSDQYWLKPYDADIKYDDINFFDHDFDYIEFMEASLSKNSKMITREASLMTPNNTKTVCLRKLGLLKMV